MEHLSPRVNRPERDHSAETAGRLRYWCAGGQDLRDVIWNGLWRTGFVGVDIHGLDGAAFPICDLDVEAHRETGASDAWAGHIDVDHLTPDRRRVQMSVDFLTRSISPKSRIPRCLQNSALASSQYSR